MMNETRQNDNTTIAPDPVVVALWSRLLQPREWTRERNAPDYVFWQTRMRLVGNVETGGLITEASGDCRLWVPDSRGWRSGDVSKPLVRGALSYALRWVEDIDADHVWATPPVFGELLDDGLAEQARHGWRFGVAPGVVLDWSAFADAAAQAGEDIDEHQWTQAIDLAIAVCYSLLGDGDD